MSEREEVTLRLNSVAEGGPAALQRPEHALQATSLRPPVLRRPVEERRSSTLRNLGGL